MISEKSIQQFMTWLRPSTEKKKKKNGGGGGGGGSSSGSGSGSTNSSSSSDNGKRQQQQEQPRTRKKQKLDNSSSYEMAVTATTTTATTTATTPAAAVKRSTKKYPRSGWPALKKNSMSFLNHGTLYLFEPVFVAASRLPVLASQSAPGCVEVGGTCIQLRGWTVCAVRQVFFGSSPNKLTMDSVLSGKFEYVVHMYEGQRLCVRQVKGLTHAAGDLDPKFRKMIPFIVVTGKPTSETLSCVVVKYLFATR